MGCCDVVCGCDDVVCGCDDVGGCCDDVGGCCSDVGCSDVGCILHGPCDGVYVSIVGCRVRGEDGLTGDWSVVKDNNLIMLVLFAVTVCYCNAFRRRLDDYDSLEC